MPDKTEQPVIPVPAVETFDPGLLDKIVRLLCNVQDRASIVHACLDKLEIAPADVDSAIEAAKIKLTRAADYHRDHEMGKSLTRLNECYQRAVAMMDTKTAISAQKEINRLLSLYPAPAFSPGEETDQDDDAEKAGDRRKIESQELSDLVGAIELYVEPLKLSADVNDTDGDLIRLAAEEIIRLRKKRPTSKKRSLKGVKDGRKKR